VNYKDKNVTIGSVVVEIPTATAILKEFGIDYCCGGHRILADVVREQGIDGKNLYERLDRAFEERKRGYQSQGNDFRNMSPALLSVYIEDTHHGYLRQAMPEAADLLTTILRVHGSNHRELYDVYRLFGQLKADLEQHLLKEETLLFPELSDDKANLSEIISLTDIIKKEHEGAGELLRELRQTTNDYTLPADACETYGKAYSLLEEIEEDLHQHIHLENNLLLAEYVIR
jgi:regulator of cell morphogenesis and NO signaling